MATGFGPVADTFVANFARGDEVGAALHVVMDGRPVVDLWGGHADRERTRAWQADTMVPVFSTTKGMVTMTLAIAHSRGWLDFDEAVATYWPEFAASGKAAITLRELLAHRAGLAVLDQPLDWDILDFHIGVPDDLPDERLATYLDALIAKGLAHLDDIEWRLIAGLMRPGSLTARSLGVMPMGAQEMGRINDREILRLQLPAFGGVGSARAVGTAYGEFAAGGCRRGRRLVRLRRPRPGPGVRLRHEPDGLRITDRSTRGATSRRPVPLPGRATTDLTSPMGYGSSTTAPEGMLECVRTAP